MADKKISELTVANAVDGSEQFPLVQAAATKKATIKDVVKFGYQDIITDATTTRTLSFADRGCYLRFTSGSAITATVPLNSSVAFAIGETINGIQAGSGQISIVGAGGVTINKPTDYNAKTRAQGAPFCLVKVAADVWDLIGDMELTAV